MPTAFSFFSFYLSANSPFWIDFALFVASDGTERSNLFDHQKTLPIGWQSFFRLFLIFLFLFPNDGILIFQEVVPSLFFAKLQRGHSKMLSKRRAKVRCGRKARDIRHLFDGQVGI